MPCMHPYIHTCMHTCTFTKLTHIYLPSYLCCIEHRAQVMNKQNNTDDKHKKPIMRKCNLNNMIISEGLEQIAETTLLYCS